MLDKPEIAESTYALELNWFASVIAVVVLYPVFLVNYAVKFCPVAVANESL